MLRFRPRISLLNALLLMTIVGMAIAMIQLWREVNPLRQEVFQRRQELGYLTVSDDSKIYAIEVPTDESDARRFRVFLPKNQKFELYARIVNVAGHPYTLPKADWLTNVLNAGSGSSQSIDGGEFTINVRLRPDPEKKDQWELESQIVGKGGGTTGTIMPWLNDRRAWSRGGEVSIGKQREFDPKEGVVLYEVRQGVVKEFKGGYSTTGADSTKDTPGVILFIAPAGLAH